MGFFNILSGKSAEELMEYIEKGAVLLDVRSDREYFLDHIQSAVHIPINELEYRVDEIKKSNKPIIVYCASGMRSANATRFLKQNGIDAINGGGISTVRKSLFK
ncbi:rhodanese-like domain-containing protein [Winogradskyella alexanderae]|uniref:Rhodanese-like domain-containing protein n=1 Tax=Winogradskyella alexanderae TaxID=2877123 RepID=A0ABS7XU27_9FLAO|nr:rhodanese-like domain-containing protein [Winogradskyella alexanderae]MCA0133290.1 rhodanese-like domain-containing protein [Winogradskyella alexanderae]